MQVYRVIAQTALLAAILPFLSLTGCQSASSTASKSIAQMLQYRFSPGHSETVRYTRNRSYKTWVEMGNQPPTMPGSRDTSTEVLMTRKVEEVMPDGSARLPVTIKEARYTLAIDTQNKKSSHQYVSTEEKSESTWDNQPGIAGASYEIFVAPDSTIKEFRGLEGIRATYGLTDASTLVNDLLSEDVLRDIHQRQALIDLNDAADVTVKKPRTVAGSDGQTFTLVQRSEDGTLTVMAANPEPTIKAKALRLDYRVQADASPMIVHISGQPAFSAPKDQFPPAEMKNVPTFIIELSDMDELAIDGATLLDQQSGTVISDRLKVECLLRLDDEKIGSMAGGNRPSDPENEGSMYTQTITVEEFKVVN